MDSLLFNHQPVRTRIENMKRPTAPRNISGLYRNDAPKSIDARETMQCVPPHVRQGIPVMTLKIQGGSMARFPFIILAAINIRIMITAQMI